MNVVTLLNQQQLLAMPESDYMNPAQRAFFRQRLLDEQQKLLQHIDALKRDIDGGEVSGDEADKAAREEDLRLLFRQLDRESRLLPKISAALTRLHNGEYGYCRESGEPIGLARLLLRPTAELSIEAKTAQEMREPHLRKRG
ncbi:RNA polymerase-binding protein DksA [Serratia proteamaculans]|jgi:DnaK suppressor protein|uniref:RNA polymerase-binding protein DksA n=1 Tax=Serratia proteamaculans TaxID=28151 RepID=A0A4Z0DYK8_SERPR|nr:MULTISPECIES: RNA polymerase-binding protein DksA [Serratia]NTX78261.1 RNA polymerase-binding protein DksA [Serratia proteamaculans]NTZ27497.1 RNA polymerase-binding protein DksA [Serratia proteamaculans]QGH59388.1 RNA polymerase-binding protein DksA [Serratia proteamaculans]TFZ51578.1 RNA polymerase-binding protein DksA [Serratia proteamaculans]CAI0715330.1 DnaK suppressor protein [Serratia quinivorans]